MTRFLRITATALAALAAATATAGDFDGSKLLICAPVEAMDCTAGEACTRGRPADIGAPAFMRIDIARKASSPILFVDKNDGQVLLQGIGYAWTVALAQADGSMTATLVDRDGVFVLFGSCTPL